MDIKFMNRLINLRIKFISNNLCHFAIQIVCLHFFSNLYSLSNAWLKSLIILAKMNIRLMSLRSYYVRIIHKSSQFDI